VSRRALAEQPILKAVLLAEVRALRLTPETDKMPIDQGIRKELPDQEIP